MIVALTPIRSGSKGIPHKNIRLLNGRPLFHHVVLQAKASPSIDEVWISTDSDYYSSLAPEGVHVHRRSAESASDDAPTADVVMEFLKFCPSVKTVVLLQATSPTTTTHDIDTAVKLSEKGCGCVSVIPSHDHLYKNNNPLWTERECVINLCHERKLHGRYQFYRRPTQGSDRTQRHSEHFSLEDYH